AIESARRSTVAASVAAGIGIIADGAETSTHAPGTNGDRPTLDHHSEIIELDSFPAMRHVTMNWPADDSLRPEVEAGLAKVLAQVATDYNPVVLWLRAFAAGLFLALLLLTAYVQL